MLFITGATGFIGHYLIRRLAKDYKGKICCLVKVSEKDSDNDTFLRKNGVIVEYSNIQESDSLAKIFSKYKFEQVIHLAAVIRSDRIEDFNEVNVLGTKLVVENCKKHNVNRLIFFSTDFILYPYKNVYRDTKLEAEEIIKNSGVPYTIFRPTPVYGLDDDKNFISLFSLIKKYPILPSLSCIMQPVHVEDVVTSILACLESESTKNKAYNLPGGSIVSFSSILKIIADEMGVRRIFIPIPNMLAVYFVRIYEKIVPNPVIRDYQISKWVLNKPLSLEQQKIDFSYNPVDFDTGIRETMCLMGISKVSKKE